MWNVPKIVSQLFEPATFRGKVEIGLSSGWNFPQRSTKEWRNAGGGGENQRLTSSAWHWLKFVFRQRIKIVPTLPSRRGRYSITHVACQLSNKGQTREKKRKKERKKEKEKVKTNMGCRCTHATNLYPMSSWTTLLQVVLKFREFKSMKVSDSFAFSLSM